MKIHTPLSMISLGIAVVLTVFTACGEQPDSTPKKESATSPSETSDHATETTPEPPKFKPTDKLAASLSEALVERRKSTDSTVKHFLKKFKKARRKDSPWSDLIRVIYSPESPRLHFVRDGAVTDAAEALIRRFEELPSHGFTKKRLAHYPLDAIHEVRETIRARSDAITNLNAQEESNGEMGALLALIKEYTKTGTQPSPEGLEIVLQERGLSNDAVGALEPAIAQHEALLKAQKSLNEALILLEIELMAGFLQYATDFQFTKIAHPFRAMHHPESAPRAFHDRLLKLYEDTDFANLDETLVKWWPENPLYLKTRTALAFYRELAKAGEQPILKKKTVLKPGMSGLSVEKLQRRLQQEGFYSGPISGTFDAATKEATIQYQTTHQLDSDGVVGGGSIRSLNLSYSQRVRQIELSLQRWRESETRGETKFHVRVNIPQFAAEFWNQQNLERMHRIVVGSNRWEVNTEKGIEGNLNRTMIFSDEVVRVVLNPLWHVPKRIKEIELDEFLTKDPDYYEANNFTVEILEDGSEKVYQNPGPDNALGLAKFLFPNEYAIYMHDTPKKHLFGKRIRAFSHGCMRVENATELAEYILLRDEKMEENEIKSAFASLKTRDLSLNTPIPIHVEYNTVSVDKDGRVLFFGDVYGYDKDFFTGKVPINPTPEAVTDG